MRPQLDPHQIRAAAQALGALFDGIQAVHSVRAQHPARTRYNIAGARYDAERKTRARLKRLLCTISAQEIFRAVRELEGAAVHPLPK